MQNLRPLWGFLFLLVAVLVLPVSGFAEDASAPGKDRLAIADFEVFLVDEALGRGVSESLRSQLGSSGKVTIIERSQLVKILEEQALQQSGIIAPEQAIETGKIVGANRMLIGSVGKLGVLIVINARMVDIGSGSVVQAWSLNAESEAQLAQTVVKLAALLSGKAPAVQPTPSASGVSGYWVSEWYDGKGKHPGSIYLQQSGDEVSGWTVENIDSARIAANVSGTSMRGKYFASYGNGVFEFTLSSDGQRLIGSYQAGHGAHGTWNAWRRPLTNPVLSAGAHVLADWSGDIWSYPGKITEVSGGKAHIAYDDGDGEWLPRERIYSLDFEPGDLVEVAQKPQADYQKATVTSFRNGELQVEYGFGRRQEASMRRVRALRVRAGGY